MQQVRRYLVILTVLLFSARLQAQQKETKAGKNETDKQTLRTGRAYYEKYACNSCHGIDGKRPGDLTGAYRKYSDSQIQEYIGDPKSFGNPKMPVYTTIIAPEHYAALISYVKHLGAEAAKKTK